METSTYLLNFSKNLIDKVPRFLKSLEIYNDQVIVNSTLPHLLNMAKFLKSHTYNQFTLLMDLTAIDYPDSRQRFVIIYQFLSIQYNIRVSLKVELSEFDPLMSLVSLYLSADWLEREVWDLFGIFFSHHYDLRRILTDYGFQGFPLRKDFPLSGFCELRYDDELKSIVYDSLELSQEFRFFDFSSPWENF